MSRARQSEIIYGFDYRPDRNPGEHGVTVVWTRAEWREFARLIEKHGGTVERFKDSDGTHTTVFRDRVNGSLDGAAEAYGL